MIYFLGKNLKENKKLKFELNKIYGLNLNNIQNLFKFLGINSTIQTKYLKKILFFKLKNKINENYIIESDLKKELNLNNLNDLNIKTIKSLRKINGLPVRGQRTKTNAKTTKKLSFNKK
jgi:small subunit ribosomal protein S13